MAREPVGFERVVSMAILRILQVRPPCDTCSHCSSALEYDVSHLKCRRARVVSREFMRPDGITNDKSILISMKLTVLTLIKLNLYDCTRP